MTAEISEQLLTRLTFKVGPLRWGRETSYLFYDKDSGAAEYELRAKCYDDDEREIFAYRVDGPWRVPQGERIVNTLLLVMFPVVP